MSTGREDDFRFWPQEVGARSAICEARFLDTGGHRRFDRPIRGALHFGN